MSRNKNITNITVQNPAKENEKQKPLDLNWNNGKNSFEEESIHENCLPRFNT